MPVPAPISKFCQYMWEHYSKDGGKLLVHMGAAGWIFSSVAQIAMLMGDKKIDKDKKKFLLPQEAADAGVNVFMYYTICEAIKKSADHFVEKGKFVTDKVVNEILEMKPHSMPAIAKKDWKNIFSNKELGGKISKVLENAANMDIVQNVSAAEKTRILDAAKKALDTFETHKNNVGTVAAIAASVLACNIVTPYVRNKIASKYQKHVLKEEAIQVRKEQITNNITMKNPLPTSFKSFNNYNSFSGIKI